MIEVRVEVSSGIFESIKTCIKKSYEKPLNGVGYFEVLVGGSDTDYFNNFDTHKLVEFYANGVLDFRGEILKVDYTNEGLLRLMGTELGARRCIKPKASKDSWQSETNETILDSVLGNVVGVSKGTVDSVNVDSFRTSTSQSCLQALNKLRKLTGQDLYFSYSGSTINVNLVNHQGSDSSVVTLVGGVDVGIVNKKKDDNKTVTRVNVIGASQGDIQVTGSYSSGYSAGDAEVTVIDKSIISSSEANARAEEEFGVFGATKYNYSFSLLDANRSVTLGDVVTLKDRRTNTNGDLRIVRVKRLELNDNESLKLEVRDTSAREAAEDLLSVSIAENEARRENESMSQGQVNYNTWGAGINAKNGSPLRLVYYVSNNLVDLNDDLKITSMTVDYQIDSFRKEADLSNESDVAPSLSAGSTDNHKHNPADSGHSHDVSSQTSGSTSAASGGGGSSAYSSTKSVSSSSWTNVYDFTAPSQSNCGGGILVSVCFRPLIATCFVDVRIADTDYSWYYPSSTGSRSTFTKYTGESILPCAISFLIPPIVYGDDMEVQMKQTYSDSQKVKIKNVTWTAIASHTHNINAITSDSDVANVDDNNRNPSLSGNAENHNHGVSIGGVVSDAASLNSTQVSLYLDYWNGSSWVQKHSVTNTGKVLDTKVDISNSGVYPDVVGFWRVRVDPNSSSPDYVKGIVSIKSSLKTD